MSANPFLDQALIIQLQNLVAGLRFSLVAPDQLCVGVIDLLLTISNGDWTEAIKIAALLLLIGAINQLEFDTVNSTIKILYDRSCSPCRAAVVPSGLGAPLATTTTIGQLSSAGVRTENVRAPRPQRQCGSQLLVDRHGHLVDGGGGARGHMEMVTVVGMGTSGRVDCPTLTLMQAVQLKLRNLKRYYVVVACGTSSSSMEAMLKAELFYGMEGEAEHAHGGRKNDLKRQCPMSDCTLLYRVKKVFGALETGSSDVWVVLGSLEGHTGTHCSKHVAGLNRTCTTTKNSTTKTAIVVLGKRVGSSGGHASTRMRNVDGEVVDGAIVATLGADQTSGVCASLARDDADENSMIGVKTGTTASSSSFQCSTGMSCESTDVPSSRVEEEGTATGPAMIEVIVERGGDEGTEDDVVVGTVEGSCQALVGITMETGGDSKENVVPAASGANVTKAGVSGNKRKDRILRKASTVVFGVATRRSKRLLSKTRNC